MRRAALGALTLVASIAIPATFHGTVFLVVLWFLVGVAGLVLIASADPVKPKWIGWLRQELQISDASTANRGPNDGQVAVARISEELEAARDVLESTDAGRFFANHEIAADQWVRYGETLVRSPPLHQSVRAAYRKIDALNNRGIRRDVTTSRGERTALIDSGRAEEALQAIREALVELAGGFS
jgi:hypothetical protein